MASDMPEPCQFRTRLTKGVLPATLTREPVWPSGKALGWKAEGPWFDPLRLSFLFCSKIVVYGHCLVILPTQLMKH